MTEEEIKQLQERAEKLVVEAEKLTHEFELQLSYQKGVYQGLSMKSSLYL